ncbi:phosphopantetheine-binding protein (plasmid) [Streptomyces sp. CA-294286]|uniref:phosphopantetheine-binding protein n=1 Tax=Streptomyces sp. CA-294286 TaxID=3240070 RepID=UPI003D8E5510
MSASYPVLVEVLTESLGVDADLVDPEATFEDLDLDSLSLLELVLILEERTGQRPESLSASSTLAEAAAVIDQLNASQDAGEPVPTTAGTTA